jgi:hypothetical protein
MNKMKHRDTKGESRVQWSHKYVSDGQHTLEPRRDGQKNQCARK